MRILMLCLLLLGMARLLALPIGDITRLRDWSDLPVLDSGRLQEATNWRGPSIGKLVDVAPGQAVLLEAQGPGCIERLSLASINGTMKVYIDGAATPQISVELNKMYQNWPWWDVEKMKDLDGNIPQPFPFLIPYSLSGPGYKNASYVPIAYAKSVKVVWEHDPARPWGYYTILHRQYPPNTPVRSFDLAELAKRKADVQQVANAWRNLGANPDPRPADPMKTGTLSIGAKATVDLLTIAGPGTLVGLRLRARPWHVAIDRLLVLRAYWDGEKRPSIEVPIGDFFASHNGFRQARVLPVGGGDKDGWYWCYLPMPFTNGARLTLENLSRHHIANLDYEITARPGVPATGVGRFCARWKRETLAQDGQFELLNATGAGKLIGFNLFVQGYPVPSQFGTRKTRMLLLRDGEAEPSIADAALMTYFYGGWYSGPNWDNPLSAVPVMEFATGGVYSEYRYFLNDAPDWTKAARLVLDVSKDTVPGTDYASVVSWYREPAGADTLSTVARDPLMPRLAIDQDAIEAEELLQTAVVSSGDLLVVDDPDCRYLAGGNAFISYAPLAFGDRLTVHIDVKAAGTYTLWVRALTGPSGGLWDVSVNGSPTPGPKDTYMFSCIKDETGFQWAYPGGWLNVGKFTFSAGDNTLAFISHPSYAGLIQRGMLLSLDAVKLAPVK